MRSSDQRFAIRPATLADAPAIAALAGELGYPTSSRDAGSRLQNVLHDSEQAVFVAEALSSGVIAWIHVFVARRLLAAPFSDVGGLVVAQDFRGSGIGQQLVDTALTWTHDQGISSIRIRTNVVRESAHGFYEALGFRREKSQHVYIKEIELSR